MQRLKTRAQYEAAMAGGTFSRTAHFVLHRAELDAPSAPKGSETTATQGSVPEPATGPGYTPKALFAVRDAWIGAVVPKRWAKRAVTRNGIKRQIYNVSDQFESRLPQAAHVVRLRAAFGREHFPSAWSDALKQSVRAELLELFERAAR